MRTQAKTESHNVSHQASSRCARCNSKHTHGLIALFFLLLIAGCGTLTDQHGNDVMTSKGVGRDCQIVEKFEATYDPPITVNIRTNLAAIPSWIIGSGMPLCNLKSLKAERVIGAKSNVGSTASGVAQAIQATSAWSPF